MQRVKLGGVLLAVALVSFAAGTQAQGRYRLINRAEGALHNALADLRHGRDVFGGHKVAAIRLIEQAVGELEAGKAFAASHGY